MNLKNFKKIHEDKDKAVLQNQRGHQITLAKKQLSKNHLDGIGKLPLYAAGGADVAPAPDTEQAVIEREIADEPQQMAPPPGPTPTAPRQPEMSPDQYMAATNQEMNSEAGNSWNDRMSGHINPKTQKSMFQDQNALGKIGTLFGLMISGAGSGLTHQPNALLEMMNKEIDRDLEAQKKNVENKQNYWKIHQQNELNKSTIKKQGAETLGTLVDNRIRTQTLAKNDMMLSATHKLLNDLNMLPNGSPQKAQAMQKFSELQGAVDAQIKENNAKAAHALANDPEASYQKKQQGLRAAGNLGILPGAESQAQANDERHVPGVGDASIPVPQNVRQEIVSHQKLQNAGEDLLEYSKKHTNIIPGTPEYNVGTQKALVLQQMVREGLLGTVFRESEKPLLNKFVSENPAGALKMVSTQPKLKALLESNAMAGNTLKEAYGLPTKKEGKPKEEEKKFFRGKWYKRGKNGEAVEVK